MVRQKQFRISALQCPTRNVMEVNYDSPDSSHSVNDPSTHSKLQEEIATFKKEIRATNLTTEKMQFQTCCLESPTGLKMAGRENLSLSYLKHH